MRTLAAVLLAALPLSAQEAPPPRPTRASGELGSVMFDYERRITTLAKAVQRDAYIIGQMVHATRDLQDFQKLAAVEKALDRTQAALKRAAERPAAGMDTMTALNRIAGALRQARQQGTMADPPALAKLIVEQTHFIQRDLFRGMEQARAERLALTDIQNKVTALNLGLEAAMQEAISSTFEFIRAGGR